MNPIAEIRQRLKKVRQAAAEMDSILATAERRAPVVCVLTVPQMQRFLAAGEIMAEQLKGFVDVANTIPLVAGPG